MYLVTDGGTDNTDLPLVTEHDTNYNDVPLVTEDGTDTTDLTLVTEHDTTYNGVPLVTEDGTDFSPDCIPNRLSASS